MNITSATLLAQALRNERQLRKISQSKAAAAVGLKQSTVSEFENSPEGTRLETLFRLLAALDLELQIIPRNRQTTDNRSWDQEW